MKKLIIICILFVEIILIILLQNNININIKTTYILEITKKEIPIGNIIIKKIKLNEDIYGKESQKNNIEEHITILKESNYPQLIILAAHSGTGKIAYFEELNKLEINDKIQITYNKETSIYKVIKIWEEPKNGKIHIENKEKQLILTTCSPDHKNYQLIISCIKKEST